MALNVHPLTKLRVVLLNEHDRVVFDRDMAVADVPASFIAKYLNDYYVFNRVDFVTETIVFRQAEVKELIP